jgi:hypothetical protein
MAQTDRDAPAALKFEEDSRKLHEEFLAWWGESRDRMMSENPGVEEWQVQLRSWRKFRDQRKTT